MTLDVSAVTELASRVAGREPVGVAKAISVVEDRRQASESAIIALLAALLATGKARGCHRVGITGPPGVGKSTLVSVLAQHVRASGRTVGVLALDPSSPRSGGALLGDRARMQTDAMDDGMFVRSMASGGDLGGLARAAGAAVDVLSTAYDVVVVETTGVGQSETDVEHVTDTVAMVVQPGSGDVLQFLKAGIIEIPSLFVVNKADLGTIADRAVMELEGALSVTGGHRSGDAPRVLRTVASTGEGVPDLLAAIDGHRDHLVASGDLESHRREARARWALKLFERRHGEVGVERAGGRAQLLSALRRCIEGGASTIDAIARCSRS